MTQPIHARLARCRGQKCRVKGCGKPVDRIGSLCGQHHLATYRHGHPLGRAIPPALLRPDQKRLRDFLKHHAKHPGVVAAEAFLMRLMLMPHWYGLPAEAQEELRRVLAQGLRPREALVRLLAVYLVCARGVWPDDIRLDYALANALLHARYHPSKRPIRKRATVFKALGKLLRHALAPLVVRVRDALNRPPSQP